MRLGIEEPESRMSPNGTSAFLEFFLPGRSCSSPEWFYQPYTQDSRSLAHGVLNSKG